MTATGADHQSPGDYLAAADVEFAAGNHDAGLDLAYSVGPLRIGSAGEGGGKAGRDER